MKRSKNFTWLILGVITIVIGLIIPFVAFNQTCYYEVEKDLHSSSVTFYVTITSNEEIKDIQNAILTLSYENSEDKEREVYDDIELNKTEKGFVYEFKFVETKNADSVEDVEVVKLKTMNGVIKIDEKIGLKTKLPIAIFTCVIGAFMIFVNFFNNNSKNRTIELKEIIASTSYNNYKEVQEEIEEENKKEEIKENIEQEPTIQETKVCEYCGTLSDINEKVCASCGAKFKKN